MSDKTTVVGMSPDELRAEVARLRETRGRLLSVLDQEKHPAICPQCGDAKIYPRDHDPYCENCGWPEEDRPDMEVGNISSAELQLLKRIDQLEKTRSVEIEKPYRVVSYLSGTTWIESLEKDCHFHVSHWSRICRCAASLPDRNQIERTRFASLVADMLNEIQEKSYTPFIRSIMAGKMEIGETSVVFTDAYYGAIVLNNYHVEDGKWEPKMIPEAVMNDLEKGFQRMLECSSEE